MELVMSDYASDAQLSRIVRLIEERAVTGAVAARIIRILDDCPGPDHMGHNKEINEAVKDRLTREP